MSLHPIFDFGDVLAAYSVVAESVAKPNGYKFLTPEQAEAVAKLSPSYRSNTTWGLTSNWICSMVNRMIKFRKVPFETAYQTAQKFSKDIADFERFGGKLKTDISAVKTFDDLHNIIEEAKRTMGVGGLSPQAKSNGRARQCYSLMKNGKESNDFVETFENEDYLIGYPTSYDYNSKFSSIGKWCHTGSFGDGQQYWNDYGQEPVFYILNKNNGSVLCAAWRGGNGEVRDQQDNYPQGFTGDNWNTFFADIGLEEPMVDNVHDTVSDYVIPDDVNAEDSESVYERIDEHFIIDNLFNGLGYPYTSICSDDYHPHNGNFYFSDDSMDTISPPSYGCKGFKARYAENPNPRWYYSFEEFRAGCRLAAKCLDGDYRLYDTSTDAYNPEELVDTALSNPVFVQMWNNATDVVVPSYDRMVHIEDKLTMSERFPISTLKRILLGEVVKMPDNSVKRCEKLRVGFHTFVRNWRSTFVAAAGEVFDGKHEKYGDTDLCGGLSISIDADEANSLAERICNNDFGYQDRDGLDIMVLNLGGKHEFAVKRIERKVFSQRMLEQFIAYIKYNIKTPMDLKGQMTLGLGD